jgi:hypothetical protein
MYERPVYISIKANQARGVPLLYHNVVQSVSGFAYGAVALYLATEEESLVFDEVAVEYLVQSGRDLCWRSIGEESEAA